MKENYLKLIGSNIRRLRKQAELTQEDVADRANLNASYYGRIERGEINVTLETLASIARALNIEINDLFRPELIGVDLKRMQREINQAASKLDAQRLQLLRELALYLPQSKRR